MESEEDFSDVNLAIINITCDYFPCSTNFYGYLILCTD